MRIPLKSRTLHVPLPGPENVRTSFTGEEWAEAVALVPQEPAVCVATPPDLSCACARREKRTLYLGAPDLYIYMMEYPVASVGTIFRTLPFIFHRCLLIALELYLHRPSPRPAPLTQVHRLRL